MNELVFILIAAIIVQYVVEGFKLYQRGRINYRKVMALVLSLVICYGASLDLFAVLGMEINTYIGIGITSIIVSFGSNKVHDLINKIAETSKTKTVK